MGSRLADELAIAGATAWLAGADQSAARRVAIWLAAIRIVEVADVPRRAAVPVWQAEVGAADPVVLATGLLAAALREVGGAVAARCGQAAAVAALSWADAAGIARGVKAAIVGATLPRAVDIAGIVCANTLVATTLAITCMLIQMLIRLFLGQLQGLAVIPTAITVTDLGVLLAVSFPAMPMLVLLVVFGSLCFGL